ncbi:hypothetical protein [Lacticaseibacillus sp. N501-2]|uniref:hypothetical protein n=1 Tax=Lacticaseibacillus salsurae TaxID=3367729 RepID=UPI0038B32FAA
MGQVIEIAKQLWFQELVWGVLLVLVIIGYVHRFNHIGRTQHLRTQRRHHRQTIGHTRWLAILIVIGAALTFVGHRYWPQVSAVAQRVYQVSATKLGRTSSHKAKPVASKSTASAHTASKKASSSKPKAKSSSTKAVTATTAVKIVKGYFKAHPSEQTDTISSYKAAGTGNDSAGAFVYKVGAYGVDDTGATSELHEYWVHRDGKFDVAY